MKVKSRVKCKGEYKGSIDGEVKHLKANDEVLCDPWLAYKLISHYPGLFEIIGSESIQEKTKKKEFKVEENKVLSEYESK